MEETRIERQTLSRDEAAKYLGVHINTLDKDGNIPRFRIGGRTLFRRKTLDAYIEELEQAYGDPMSRGGKCRT